MNALQNARCFADTARVAAHVQIPVPDLPNPLREKVTILIISSPEGVRETSTSYTNAAMPKLASGADYYPPPIQAKS